MTLGARVGIIGVGVIGGSIARRLRFSGFASYVLGIGRNEGRLRAARDKGIIDAFSLDYTSLAEVDMVILSTPLDHIIANLPVVLESARPGTVVLDVGSVKQPVVDRYEQIRLKYPDRFFVPSHPVAGSHLSGFENSRKDMFLGRVAVVCPLDNPEDVISQVKLMYNFLGMDVILMPAEEHDDILAYTSHLPHLISFAFRDVVPEGYIKVSGGAFRDISRISNADIRLWNGIFRHNKEKLSASGRAFQGSFQEKLAAIENEGDIGISYLPHQEIDGVYSVAIDGPAGAGKSTIAKLLAMRLNFRLIDTGAMYRAATLACMRKGIALDDVEAVLECIRSSSIELTEQVPPRVVLNGEDVSEEIRLPEVTNNVFYLAREPRIREYMVELQRNMALSGRAVIEGRDITTVVLPEARFKFYLDASFEERFLRRFKELKDRGVEVDEQELRQDMLQRDANDLKREVGPLRKAPDAFYVDSTNLSIEQTLNVIFYEIKRRCANEEINI